MTEKPTEMDGTDEQEDVEESEGRHPRIERAMKVVPRALFLTEELQTAAQHDLHLPLPEGQTTPPPSVIQRMLEALDPRPDEKILEVGTGSGYTAALLGELAEEVYSIERLKALAFAARDQLEGIGADNVKVYFGNGLSGLSRHAPYDGILISATVDQVPEDLVQQLTVGGRMVLVTGAHEGHQELVRVHRVTEESWEGQTIGQVRFVELLGDILVQLGATSREDVEKAAKSSADSEALIGEELVRQGLVGEAEIYQALARQRGLKHATIDALVHDLDREFVRSFDRAFLERHRVIPIRRFGQIVKVATVEPDNPTSDLASELGVRELDLYLVSPTDYRRLWSAIELGSLGDAMSARPPRAIHPGGPRLARVLNELLSDAVEHRAEELHLERYGDEVRLRYRIDGRMHDISRFSLSPEEMRGIVDALKVAAEMNVTLTDVPQTGRVIRRLGGRQVELRIRTQPALHGEDMTLRLLGRASRGESLDDLELPNDVVSYLHQCLEAPRGLVLLVDVEDVARARTMYGLLNTLADDSTRKVVTVENPIEFGVRGVQQTQPRPSQDFSHLDAVRAAIEQQPDVLVIANADSPRVMREVLETARRGRLVVAGAYGADVTEGLDSVMGAGLPRPVAAEHLLAVLAQRFARRICHACREEVEPPASMLKVIFGEEVPEDFECYEGAGCGRCDGLGTRGRIPVVEFLPVDRSHTKKVAAGPSRAEIDEMLQDGTMRDHALKLVREGIIPLDELSRIMTPGELRGDGNEDIDYEADDTTQVPRD